MLVVTILTFFCVEASSYFSFSDIWGKAELERYLSVSRTCSLLAESLILNRNLNFLLNKQGYFKSVVMVPLLKKAVVLPIVLVQEGLQEPSGLSLPRSSGAKTGSRKPELPPILGAVSQGVINKDGISFPTGLNSNMWWK